MKDAFKAAQKYIIYIYYISIHFETQKYGSTHYNYDEKKMECMYLATPQIALFR